ncbi:MAG: hypothetical protein K2O18_15920 [Oscillospiraceae bacterium]|nr:hypothetical protein [Oscillospiraceae bacterium]
MGEETRRKRGRKTVETRIAEIEEMIANLQAEKERLLWPAMKQKIFEMVPPEMSPQEFADRLGILWGDAQADQDEDDNDESEE